jgi:hypothetical protein
VKKPVTKKPKMGVEHLKGITVEVQNDELKQLAGLAARYAVADPGKDARDDFFRRVAKLA